MLTLTPEQFAALSLPDPFEMAPTLAAEIRRDYPALVADQDNTTLTQETLRSYAHGGETLGITHLPTLVAWVKADVAWARGLRREPSIDLWLRMAQQPSRMAQDILSGLRAGADWPKEGA